MDYTDKGGSSGEKGRLGMICGDVTLGVSGRGFHYIFSYARGGPESFVINGKEWLYRTPSPAYWRAATDNDRGNGFPLRSGMWLGADQFPQCVGCRVWVDGGEIPVPKAPENNRYTGRETADKIKILFTYETVTVPTALTEVSYEISAGGSMEVRVHYHGVKGLPELPVLGLKLIMPTAAVGYRYEGMSGETYPDRMAGAEPGIFDIDGMPVTQYLVPQDCNVHMETKWLEVYRDTVLDNSSRETGRFGLRFEAVEKPFAFSCIPYTAQELENATHQEELPPARRTVVSILGAVRGVGGIDSWGSDVEPAYHIDAGKDISYSFIIRGA